MVNYQNGKIYKIVCNITGEIYIGSTTLALSQRLAGHRRDYLNYVKGKITKCQCTSSFQIIERGDYNIISLELYPCLLRDELLRQERFYFDNIDCINKVRPYATKYEQIEKIKIWRTENKESILQRCKIY